MWIIEQDDFTGLNQQQTSWVKPIVPLRSPYVEVEREPLKENCETPLSFGTINFCETPLSTSTCDFQSFPLIGFLFEKNNILFYPVDNSVFG